MEIFELKYSNGVVGNPYAEGLCHSVSTLNNYITVNCCKLGGSHLKKRGTSNPLMRTS